jgi:anti-sigma-K factor RskA
MEAASQACTGYEAKLEDYLSGQLSGTDAKQVAEHLKNCGGCAAALSDARASVRLLQVADCTPDPGSAFAHTSMARIRMEIAASEEAKGFWQPFVSLAWRFAATATVALAVMAGYDVVRQRTQLPEPTVASVQQADVRDLFTTDADRVPANRDDVLVMVAETEHGKQ